MSPQPTLPDKRISTPLVLSKYLDDANLPARRAVAVQRSGY